MLASLFLMANLPAFSVSHAQDVLANSLSVSHSRYVNSELAESVSLLPSDHKSSDFLKLFFTDLQKTLAEDDCHQSSYAQSLKLTYSDQELVGLVTLLRQKQWIDDVLFIPLVRELAPPGTDPTADTPQFRLLENVKIKSACSTYRDLTIARNTYLPKDSAQVSSEFANTKVPHTHGLTQQVYLYQHYDGTQIIWLAKLYQHYQLRVGAGAHAVIENILSDGTIERRPLTPQELYREAAALLHQDVEALKGDAVFFGKEVTFDDVIMAAFETGLVTGKDIQDLKAIQEIWDPRKTQLQKFSAFLSRYGGPVAILIPLPWQRLTTLAILFINSVASKSEKKSAVQRGVSLF